MTDRTFTHSTPELYNRYMGPLLFEPYAKLVAQALACGYTFVLILQNAYPINVLNAVRNVPEVCSIFCATANPVQIVVAQNEQGRGVLGVIDGSSPKGIEGPQDVAWRHELLRKFGYKR